ncbi:hypothetical protein NPIL_616701 [Nephila pilipes]|uniref:Uncharacterized protein n=1 Tax=Nephila pilipes TaxID=299642 RepID=A0A8X6TX51_NEPPI|nr:hypothetical protein NPIL_616701 [Nephila pilipes]
MEDWNNYLRVLKVSLGIAKIGASFGGFYYTTDPGNPAALAKNIICGFLLAFGMSLVREGLQNPPPRPPPRVVPHNHVSAIPQPEQPRPELVFFRDPRLEDISDESSEGENQ